MCFSNRGQREKDDASNRYRYLTRFDPDKSVPWSPPSIARAPHRARTSGVRPGEVATGVKSGLWSLPTRMPE
ncbi:hypothetical protein ABIE49_000642 [Bradyrhizobium sp. OAE829]